MRTLEKGISWGFAEVGVGFVCFCCCSSWGKKEKSSPWKRLGGWSLLFVLLLTVEHLVDQIWDCEGGRRHYWCLSSWGNRTHSWVFRKDPRIWSRSHWAKVEKKRKKRKVWDKTLPCLLSNRKLGDGHLFCFWFVLLCRYMCVFDLGFTSIYHLQI